MANSYGYSDQPAARDELGFTPSVEALHAIISDSELADTPLTIGIYGQWGSGKTSLMKMILAKLDHNRCVPVEFGAWRYAQVDTLWRALLLEVIKGLRTYLLNEFHNDWLVALIGREHALAPETTSGATDAAALAAKRKTMEARLEALETSLYRSVEHKEDLGGIEIDWPQLGQAAARTTLRLGLNFIPVVGPLAASFAKLVEKGAEQIAEQDTTDLFAAIKRREAKIVIEQVRSLDQFYHELSAVINAWIVEANMRLVVFIDDLDRCLPEEAIGVLEAIKVFLDIQGCIFVLGVDRAIIERGIRVRYKEFALAEDAARQAGAPLAIFPVAGRDYLEKIVQLPFEMPPLETAWIKRFLHERVRSIKHLDTDTADKVAALMAEGLSPNPRKVKRTFNSFRLLLDLRQRQKLTLYAELLAKLVVMQSSYADIYEQIVTRPALLKELEGVPHNKTGTIYNDSFKQIVKSRPRLDALLYQQPLFANLDDATLHSLIYQTLITQDRQSG